MTDRWEYLAVAWQESCQTLSTEPPKFAFRRELFIYRPSGDEPERLLLWSTEESEEVSGTTLFDAVNEIGAEGWEMVTDLASESVIGHSTSTGWHEAGRPVSRQWWFKRRV